MKVLVCDDKEAQCDETVAIIQQVGVQIQQLGVQEELAATGWHPNTLTKILREFFGGIRPSEENSAVESEFDEYAIILLDNNLSALEIEGARLTAEAIAGYLRAYSKATYIVSLNKNPEVDFDLRYLVGDYSTVADLALNTPHLMNRALWTGNPAHADDRFKPWYWPALLNEPKRRTDQIDLIRQNLGGKVTDALGIPHEVASHISRHATGTLSPEILYDSAPVNIPFQISAVM